MIFVVETAWFSRAQLEEVERWLYERELRMGQAAFNLKPAVKFNRGTRRERRGKHLGWLVKRSGRSDEERKCAVSHLPATFGSQAIQELTGSA